NHLGWLEILVPVIGALIVGFMARYGSDKIRGHGIPEALESILINGSKIEPKVALLKPISSAISIGSGGPFGAEGPIIMTGGAVGSMIAQFFHLSSAERKTLLAAGAAGGMTAVFGTPVAAVLLAVEVMLFEWKPRSLIPVALASATSALFRYYLVSPTLLFPVPPHVSFIGPVALIACVLVGIIAGVASMLLTMAVYASEDAFHHLPIHWMWWPAIGGVVIGIGGLIFPQALGVGYDVIGMLLKGNIPLKVIIGILIVKSIIWSFSLGSGTSGGIVAPILMIGGALGGVEAIFLPNEGAGFWALISMAAVMGGTMRAPLTGILFALEVTHDVNSLLPLLIAVAISYTFSVLFMRRSILTEKVSRRGYHLSSEYATDPLEIIFVREVMRTNVVALSSSLSPKALAQALHDSLQNHKVQHLYPILNATKQLVGVVTRRDLQVLAQEHHIENENLKLDDVLHTEPVVAYADEPLRTVVYRMADTGYTRFPVVERENPRHLVGIVSLQDLLKARSRNLDEERRRERVLHLHLFFPGRGHEPQALTTKEEIDRDLIKERE
ncbi:MAG TPA: chloride channel protein, partial [Ktedonobacter sp.]|nr:chloride channel protein [Ktedonobacter sp.]